jgi:hypothetical protein
MILDKIKKTFENNFKEGEVKTMYRERDERYLWKSTTAKKLSTLSTGTKTFNRFQEKKIVGKTQLC